MKENKIIKSSLVVMAFVIVGKALALIREALVASRFGVSSNTDIYMFSIGMVYLLTSVSYGLTTTFIPIQSEHIEKQDTKKNNAFINNVLNISLLATAIVTVFCIIFSKQIIIAFAPGFTKDPKVFYNSVSITRVMFISLFFVTAQSILAGVLQAHKHFYVPALSATCSNIVYIIYLVFFAEKYGIYGFAWASVMGFFIQFAINIPQYKKLGYKYKLFIDFKDKELIRMLLLMIPVVISTSTVQLNLFANRYFATLLGKGFVSALDFSNKLNTIVDEVFATTISIVIFPTLASFAAKKNTEEFNSTFIKAVNVVLMIMVPAAVATAILRIPLVTVIFKRGAFDDSATAITASALLFYSPSMIANGLRGILNKAFYSVHDTKTPMINGLIGIVVNILISFSLFRIMKVSGLTLSSTIAGFITTIYLLVQLEKKIPNLNIGKISNTLLKIILSSTAMGVFLYLFNKFAVLQFGSNMKGSLIIILSSAAFGSIIYFVCIYFLRVDEYMDMVQLIKKRRFKN